MREGEFRISSGCAIACIFHADGKKENGVRIQNAMKMMHDRSNGLGGGFAAYGIYPDMKDYYAVHIFYESEKAKRDCEEILFDKFSIIKAEVIPTKQQLKIKNQPLIWRYFVDTTLTEDEIVDLTFYVHQNIKDAYIFSCGKNMGIFKGVGYPEDIAEFFMLDQYFAHTWIAHGRYPTNTPGWWAGAHPFGMLDFAVVHNGEISSYDANRRYIQQFGYPCCLLTDTEVITYIFDFLHRRKKLNFVECSHIVASPFWNEIDQMDEQQYRYYTMLRRNFGSLLITGPFSIIVGHKNGIFALNDRLKLRALMVARKNKSYYLASEESAIRAIQEELDEIYSLEGGKAFVKEREFDDE